MPVRPLNTRERLLVFRRAISARTRSPLRSAALFSLLLFGAACYELGRLRREPRNGKANAR